MLKTALMLSLVSSMAFATDPKADDPRAVADKYLLALGDPDHPAGKDYLLGGLNADAVTAMEFGAKITSKAAPRSEDGSLAGVAAQIAQLDAIGLELSGQTDLSQLSREDARKLTEQTKQQRQALFKKFPVFADLIRTDRPLYWYPKNPMRELVAGKKGTCHIDYVAFTVSSKETSGKAHTWPLRIVRFKTDTLDEGYKVLASSAWDPE